MPQQRTGDREPCGWCVRSTVPPGSTVADPVVTHLRPDTDYERVFLEQVLGSLPELCDWTI